MTERDDEGNFARNMAARRAQLNMSQSELARKMVERGFSTYSQMTVSRTEKGERPIRLSEARVLAELLSSSVASMTRGTTLEELLASAMKSTEKLTAAIMAVPLALRDYDLVEIEETTGAEFSLSNSPELKEPSLVRDAFENLLALRFPLRAIAEWAGEVAVSNRDIDETTLTVGDVDRLRELAERYRG